MSDRTDEQRIGELLGELPPAPPGWVEAAAALPAARRALDAIDERVLADAAARAEVTAALEQALRDADVPVTPEQVLALRRLLDEPG
jgi:hypothetical protein